MRDFKPYLEILLAPAIAALVFLGLVLLGRTLGLAENTLAAAEIFTGALVALRAFQLNRRTPQEPWSVTFLRFRIRGRVTSDPSAQKNYRAVDEAWTRVQSAGG